MQDTGSGGRRDLPAALYIGRDNSVAVIGRSWRCTQDLANALGLKPRRVGRVALYSAAEFVTALERSAAQAMVPESEQSDATELARMRRSVAGVGAAR